MILKGKPRLHRSCIRNKPDLLLETTAARSFPVEQAPGQYNYVQQYSHQKKIKLYDFFEYIAGGNTFNYNKPDPRHLTSTIEIIGGNLKKSIMIGDSETDSRAAKAAEVPFILIEDGYTEKKPDQIYYDYLIKNFIGLEKIIQKYIND